MPITISGPWSDTTSTFQSMSLDDDDEIDEVRADRGHHRCRVRDTACRRSGRAHYHSLFISCESRSLGVERLKAQVLALRKGRSS